MKKTRIMFFSYPEFSGSARYLYEYINKTYKDKYELQWYCRYEDKEEVYKKNKLNYVKYDNENIEEIVKTSDIIFDTHGIAIKYNLTKTIYVNLWHGIGPKKAGFLSPVNDITKEDLEYSQKMEDNIDYFITPAPFWNYVHGQLFNTNNHRMLELGSPRIEAMIKSKKKLKGTEKYKKIIFYMPTVMNNGNRQDDDGESGKNIINLERYDDEELLKFLEENNFLLVIRYHPSEKTEHLKLEHKNILNLNNDYLFENKLELYEVLQMADILITDYSSVYFDYLLLNRPIIFLQASKDVYAKKRGYIFDNYDFWFFDYKLTTLVELKKVISDISLGKDILKEERIKKAEFFLGKDYYDNTLNASKNIYEYFFNDKYKLKDNISLSYKKTYLDELFQLRKNNGRLEDENIAFKKELDQIKNSKGWRALEKLRKIKNK